ncbi:MAG: 16S rRNA (cytidine(1402)-2'-O)-methyltransferase [Hoeflea sp.]|uniref:16S rRNA (cytidine(1402)-2'-O)-methyltransferase n=1 Tax=Hoeflea sp. TaxID=1940281 RepID=UPI001D64C440|nr:16S rRNA (cytidine(1402)-2'-O)-methyltransferase [Hoeflea sp.]MBU4531448.1 16S rRNA (cytidine(1402)-2'-O)-methyltransferase [Alphaproteobacteria bacterium]MBU4544305.1 16S rRNA (cytidine(1402)-2'-O)-methyltransferase [Alphaproteobacteria bacterium]MBU4550458.1 16S rRNA (cytidine(1402)-2'-O)-methyltransferase [Alphaproteobacteria bacterium]MBV1724724.1 16S rRNA (cytidine(1402)-2'-O)-methyltransferase [Hoeflea sp.]MBV1760744.1 16S rRNA (cytidine(1402)-2'-O)-methyltransferase [Hoeflea sp.]
MIRKTSKATDDAGKEANAAQPARSFRIGAHEIPARPLEPGLYLVSTPIGNLGDMTLRGLETLAGAGIIACEDTRVSRVLLDRYGIATRPYAYHEHNAERVGPKLMAALEAGKSVALISDAGTPLISDPGYRLSQSAIEAGVPVIPIPGASAPMAALVASGLPSDAFLFAGFLPSKDKARRDRLASLAATEATLMFFESPNRLAACLRSASEVLGPDRPAAVCRELTKAFEEVRRGTLGELAASYDEENVRGEIVLVIGPGSTPEPSDEDVDGLLVKLARDLPAGKAATEAARLTGQPRKDLYQRLLAMKDRPPGDEA